MAWLKSKKNCIPNPGRNVLKSEKNCMGFLKKQIVKLVACNSKFLGELLYSILPREARRKFLP